VVRWRPDGSIEYIGRNDHQVKLRGFRIELGEIETRLADHAALREVCAVVRQHDVGDARLVAYYALRPGQTVTTTDLRKHLRASLPDYMVPQAFVELPELPRTPNGKVDRKALPAPFAETAAVATVAPRTANEKLVAKVWCELLGRPSVDVHDNFFEIGGHSMLVLRSIARIEAETGTRLGPRAFVVDTLEQLAAQLPSERTPPQPPATPPTKPPADEPRGLLGRVKRRIFG
jgi:hypothetical protein